MEKHWFKTAEFAVLCGVKKDTLLYYDHIGLLKPQRVGENGYRYYSARQLSTYDLIATLRRLDMPLKEIKRYFARRSPEGLLSLLREKEVVLQAERRRLERMGKLMQETIRSTELVGEVKPGSFVIETQPAVWCAVVKAPAFERFEESVYLLHIRKLLAWARENGSVSRVPGDVVCRESLERDSFLEDYYYCEMPRQISGWPMRKKPGGTYAVLYHEGSYQSQSEACRKLRDWVLERGYTIDGDLYEEDLVNDATSENPESYLLKLSLKIKENTGKGTNA